jgi:hypothetical protein
MSHWLEYRLLTISPRLQSQQEIVCLYMQTVERPFWAYLLEVNYRQQKRLFEASTRAHPTSAVEPLQTPELQSFKAPQLSKQKQQLSMTGFRRTTTFFFFLML